MNARGLKVLRHALGLAADGQGKPSRDHFVTGAGSDDFADCVALAEAGLMRRHPPSPLSGHDDVFVVTEAGRRVAALHVSTTGTASAAYTRAVISDAVRAGRQSIEAVANLPNTTVNERLEAIDAIGKEVDLMRDALLAHASVLHIQREEPRPVIAGGAP